jgi:hypothetical protein
VFGTVRPHPCALPPSDRAAYRQLYCGTCKGLGEYALAARALVSYDVVLLSAVISGVQQAEPGQSSCRCPLNPLVHKPIVSPAHPSMRAGAAVQLLLADAWLEDHAQDGMPAVGWLRPLLPVQQALDTLSSLGFDAGPLRAVTERQREVERAGAGPQLAALPTAELVGHVLSSAIDLPGAESSLQTGSARAALRRMGLALGEVIYLVDALEDLAKDAAKRAFNPCLDAQGRPDAAQIDKAARTLKAAVETLSAGVASFPWRRNQGLLEHTIQEQLPVRVAGAVRAARETLAASALPPAPVIPWSRWWWGKLLAFAGDEAFDVPAEPPREESKEKSGCKHCDCDCCHACDCGCDSLHCCACLEGAEGCTACGTCCEGAACCECGSCG